MDEKAHEQQPEHAQGQVQEQQLPWSFHQDLVGIREIADALGVSHYRVRRWIERQADTNCPNPVRRLKHGPVYDIGDWRGWFALWRITRGSESWRRRKDKEQNEPR